MSEKKEIVRAAGILGSATILSRIMGMVRDMIVSRLFGAGMATDAFFAAFQIPNMLRRFFAEGALTSAFVPIFAEQYRHDPSEARRLANICFTLLVIVMCLITIAGILLSPLIVRLMFPGFSTQPDKFALTVFLNRLMFPYIFLISLVALCMGILNTIRHFFTPAISTVLLNLSMIAAAWLLYGLYAVPIISLAVGVLIGGVLQLSLQLPVLYQKGFRIKPDFSFKHPAVRRIALLMGPSVFGVGVYYLNLAVGSVLASLLPQGSVSYLYYAQRFFEFPQGIFTVAVAQAVLPSLSRQAAANDIPSLKDSLSFGLKLITVITIPAMIGLWICSVPVYSLLFMWGEFTFATAVSTASALRYYLLGLTVVAMVRVIVPAFYAMKDTRTPVITAFIAFIANLLFSIILMRTMLHAGLALASSLSALVNFIFLALFLQRKIGPFGLGGVITTALKSVAASLPMSAAVYGIIALQDWSVPGHSLEKSVFLAAAICTGVLLYIPSAVICGCSEVKEALLLVRNRLAKRRGGV